MNRALWFLAGIIALTVTLTVTVMKLHAQVITTYPVVSNCSTTGTITVCQMTDSASQKTWLIVENASGGISVVEDNLWR